MSTFSSVLLCLAIGPLVAAAGQLGAAGPASAPADGSPVFDIPRLDNVSIDGDAADWGDGGFKIGPIMSYPGNIRPAANFDPYFRLAWDDRGLLVLATVRDDTVITGAEAGEEGPRDLFSVLVVTPLGGDHGYKCDITGADPNFAKTVPSFWTDSRDKDALGKLACESAGKLSADGYVIEAMLPWSNLGIKPEKGMTIGVQLSAFDADSNDSKPFVAQWYPMWFNMQRWQNVYAVRLVDGAALPCKAVSYGKFDLPRRILLGVYADPTLSKGSITINSQDGTVIGQATLTEQLGRPFAKVVLPMPLLGQTYGRLAVCADGQQVGLVALPDSPEIIRAKALLDLDPRFKPCVFAARGFPECGFENPLAVEDLIGPYTIRCTFYNADHNKVATAEKPGRYGAVVEIVSETGRKLTRFRTLYRAPDDFMRLIWDSKATSPTSPTKWDDFAQLSIPLHKELGIDKQVYVEQSGLLAGHIIRSYLDSFSRDSESAAVLAWLAEAKPGDVVPDKMKNFLTQARYQWGLASCSQHNWECYQDNWEYQTADRRWWVELKRKLYGCDKEFTRPSAAPVLIEGKPATVLHEGPLQKAGFTAEGIEKVDKLLQDWAADSDQGFAVCIARHGVIALHKGYGSLDGQPYPLDRSNGTVASLTKFFGATLMWQFVDQGLIDLDDDIAKFLPPLRGIAVAKPVTIRHLYTHTSGLWGHWGDWANDMEQFVAEYYPYLKVGARFEYNGTDNALAGKIMEMVSGQCLPDLYKKLLLEPLGMKHTSVTGSNTDLKSVPKDLATWAQMILNKGAYGDKRFFRPETLHRMMPQKLTEILGPDTDMVQGIGNTLMQDDILNPGSDQGSEKESNDEDPSAGPVIGHGSGSSNIVRIDFGRDLVIVMTRYTAGKNFSKYVFPFFQAVHDAVE